MATRTPGCSRPSAAPGCAPTSPPPFEAVPRQLARFFRPTAGLRNPLLDPVLASLDLRLASWTRRPYDTRSGDGRRVLERLTGRLGPGDILLLHDGNAGLTPAGEPLILAVLPRLLAAVAEARLSPVTLTAAGQ